MMKTVFLINDTLLFEPDEHSLRPWKDSPVARLLSILLQVNAYSFYCATITRC